MKATRTYFPGLNGLRFFAATLVIFHHLEQYKFWAGDSSFWGQPLIDALGHKPVGLFFVLSGFLITYLLLEEKKQSGNIDIQQFYLKRVFRIWPLYFLIVFLAVVVVPSFSAIAFGNMPVPNKTAIIIPLILILPNLLRVSFPTLIGANQLWSVGIEEQFYLFWPLLVRRFLNNMTVFLLGFIAIKLAIHVVLVQVMQVYTAGWLMKVERLYALFPVEQMAVGALAATFLFQKNDKVLAFLGSARVASMAMVLLILSSFYDFHGIVIPLLEAVLFMIIIYQITINKSIYKTLENKTLIYLGSISYGIYMWHTLAIFLCYTLFKVVGISNGYGLLFGTLSFTFLFAALSFKYLEQPAQKLRLMLNTSQKSPKLTKVSNA